MTCQHGVRRIVPGGVCIEAAVEFVAAAQQWTKPTRIGTHARGGDADAVRMNRMAADRIDRRFAQNDCLATWLTDPEVASVLSRTRRHASPSD